MGGREPQSMVALSLANVAGSSGLEGLRLKLAVTLQQDFHLALGFFEFLPTGTRKLHAFVKKLERPIEGHITLFQFSYDRFQALQGLFELCQVPTPAHILAPF